MAMQIHFPCTSASTNYHGLSAALVTLIEAGHDPGPRGPQIRGLGLSLGALLPQLRDLALPQGVQADAMTVLVACVERLSVIALAYAED
jgi:hypothetical protein